MREASTTSELLCSEYDDVFHSPPPLDVKKAACSHCESVVTTNQLDGVMLANDAVFQALQLYVSWKIDGAQGVSKCFKLSATNCVGSACGCCEAAGGLLFRSGSLMVIVCIVLQNTAWGI